MTNATAPFRLPGGKVNTQRVWQYIKANPQHVVLSIPLLGGFGPSSPEKRLPGDRISIVLPNHSVTNVTIIATMNGGALGGLITTSEDILNSLKINGSQYALLSLDKGVDADKVSITMKRDFLAYGMQVIVLSDLLARILQTVQSFLGLFQGFLGLGLIVGIAGLGIIATRVVVERRQEIGMLRVLGFTKRMILASFLLENSSVASLSILIGVFMGIDLGYAFATSPGFTAPFTIPFFSIVEITLIAYAFAMLSTVWSALRASRIPPAEALRYIE
jgi:putative ABC transport system permease protein